MAQLCQLAFHIYRIHDRQRIVRLGHNNWEPYPVGLRIKFL